MACSRLVSRRSEHGRCRRLIGSAANGRPHDRLDLPPSSENHRFHAGDDGVPDALLPRRSLLGRAPGKRSDCRSGYRRQPDVHRARDYADARGRHDDPRLSRGRAQRARTGAAGADAIAAARRVHRRPVPHRRHRAARIVRGLAEPGCRQRGRRELLSVVVHSGDGAAVSDGGDGRGAARNRKLQARHGRANGHGDHQHRARAGAHVRLDRHAAHGRRRRRTGIVRRHHRRHDLARVLLLRCGVVPEAASPLHAERQHVGAGAENRIAGRRRVRVHRGVSVRGLHRQPSVWRRRSGGLRHRAADHSGRLHADRRARLRRCTRRRPEFWRTQGGARARDVQARGAHGGERHGALHYPLRFRRRGDDSILLVRSGRHRGRRRIFTAHLVEPCRGRRRVRERQHLSGDGQYDSAPDRVVRANSGRRDSCDSAFTDGRLRAALDLVPLCCGDDAAADDEPAAAQARTSNPAGVLRCPAGARRGSAGLARTSIVAFVVAPAPPCA